MIMKRKTQLIDRNDLDEMLEQHEKICLNRHRHDEAAAIRTARTYVAIACSKAERAEDIAHWMPGKMKLYVQCEMCGKRLYYADPHEYRYCPNCGTRMEE